MEFTIILGIALLVFILFAVICAFAWYRIVSPTQAHLVVTPRRKLIVSSDDSIATDKRKTYFAIPEFIPFLGRKVRVMDLTIKEIVQKQISYEKNQARFNVTSSTKYRISDVKRAAETFDDDEELRKQLQEVIISSTNAIASQYDVVVMRSKKQEMSEAILKEMADDLSEWGLQLVSFQLIDFLDTEDSSIISDISKRREVEIEARTREENAEKLKAARIKEAQAEELAKTKEIEKDKIIAEREQDKNKAISIREKEAEEKKFEVVQVQTIKQAEIDKEKAIVLANQDKETEAIIKDKKKLEGEGDRLKSEEQAKGEAAPIREKGFAEAEAKEKLQSALNKFKDDAIRALVAEKIVEMQKDVGIASAKALETADMKVFVGDDAKSGFDLGKMISSIQTSNDGAAESVLNYLARPNDLGLAGLSINTEKPKKSPKKSDGSISSE